MKTDINAQEMPLPANPGASPQPKPVVSIGPYDASQETIAKYNDRLKTAEAKLGLLQKDLAHHKDVKANGHGVAVSPQGLEIARELKSLVQDVGRSVPPHVSQLGDELRMECQQIEPWLEELLGDTDMEEEDAPEARLANLLRDARSRHVDQLVED